MRCPCAFVGHDRCVDSLCDFGHLINALHRLFHVEQIVFFHRLGHLNGEFSRRITLIRIHTDFSVRSQRLAHLSNQLHVSLGVHTAFELDSFDSFALCLERFFNSVFNLHQAKTVGDRYAVAKAPAEQLIDRHIHSLPDDVVQRRIDRSLAVGITLHALVHQGVNGLDPPRILAR